MNAMIDDETLDRQLREAAPYIDDEGFTAGAIIAGGTGTAAAKMKARQEHAVPLCRQAISLFNEAKVLSGGGRFVREGMIQLSSFPIWLLLVLAFGCGLLVGAFAVIFAIRKTPEVRDVTQLRF